MDKGLDEAGLKAGDEVGHRHIAICTRRPDGEIAQTIQPVALDLGKPQIHRDFGIAFAQGADPQARGPVLHGVGNRSASRTGQPHASLVDDGFDENFALPPVCARVCDRAGLVEDRKRVIR